ncbi:flagellar basal body rod protein FlgB [Clostridium sp. MSJ-11]|uniref:Flagellar basal body rod protein FlgB n=1 Tax=Clostridium mobile TaxID=2841512 RepID=A0ABS6EEZ4_9CLOT|nr:flagellar basal body rod protein FlgB [Clostridium mobile]MBU5483040.1 flagellar basal body rod protein FlgB [Clostridium mobile]
MKIGDSSIDKRNYNLIKKALDVSTERSRVIANNMANVNTANYKRNYVVFEENLREVSEKLELKKTSNSHINTASSEGEMEIKRDETSSMRQDGNNVNIDLEKVNQAANTLTYNALINQINGRFSTKRYIINGK